MKVAESNALVRVEIPSASANDEEQRAGENAIGCHGHGVTHRNEPLVADAHR